MSDVVSFFELVADATIFASAFDKAKAKAAEFGSEWMKMSQQVAAGAAEVDAATAKVGKSGPKITTGGLGLVGLQAAAYGLLALGAAALGVLAITQRLVEAYAEYSAQILRNSQALGMNAQDLQTWERIAGIVGIDQQSLVLGFERFGKILTDGAPALRATGVTLEQLGITTRNVSTAILQLADYFHSHTDQAQKAAIATALFGRSGTQLIPILDQGSAAMERYKKELEAAGVILSNSQLMQGAQAQASLAEFTNAFDAAKNELVGAALPGFSAFFQTLSIIMENNAGLWIQIGQTIGNVVMFITGLIAGLAGVSLKDVLAAPSDAGKAYEGLNGSASGAAGGMNNAASAAQRATTALDAHIQALQDAKRAQDELYDAQKQALQDQLDNLHDVTDTRRRQGEDLVSYERRLEELGLQDKIKAIDKAKKAYDQRVDDHIRALEKEKAAVKAAAGAMGDSLVGGMNAGMTGLNKSLAAGMTLAQKNLLAKAHDIGQTIAGIFSDNKGTQSAAAEHLGEVLGAALGAGMMHGMLNWIGRLMITTAESGGPMFLGKELLSGIFTGMWDQLTGHATGYVGTTEHIARISEGNQPEAVIPLRNRSAALAIMNKSGLGDLARSAGVGSGSGGAGGTPAIVVNFNNYGPIADELVAVRVTHRIAKEVHKRGLGLTRGI